MLADKLCFFYNTRTLLTIVIIARFRSASYSIFATSGAATTPCLPIRPERALMSIALIHFLSVSRAAPDSFFAPDAFSENLSFQFKQQKIYH